MHTSGFTHAPLSKYLLLYAVCSALLVTATDTKHYFPLSVHPHLWKYGQWWRLLTWPLAYTNSTEVLFAGVTIYQVRVVERIWGTRKMASFLLSILPYTTLLPPILLILLRPLSLSTLSSLPAGPTALIFALLAQYHAAVPYTYRYRVASSSSASSSSNNNNPNQPTTSTSITTTTPTNPQPTQTTTEKSIELTSKSPSYLPALQLALSQLPGSLLPAAVGWAVGYAWRLDLLPFPNARWRVPEWVVGIVSGSSGQGAGRRRTGGGRREGEGGVGEASGVGQGVGGGEGRRRGGLVG